MPRVIWTETAREDLVSIREYIAEENPSAARRVAGRIREAVNKLTDQPRLGRPVSHHEVRKLTISGFPYVVYYLHHESADAVFVVRVMHDARQVGRPE